MAYTVYGEKAIKVLPPAVTITAAGRISLNAPLTRMFRAKGIESVLLMFDIEGQKIALRPAAKTDKRTYRLAYSLCQAFIGVSGFLKRLGWDGEVYKIAAEWEEKKALLEFKMPKWGAKAVIIPVAAGQKKVS